MNTDEFFSLDFNKRIIIEIPGIWETRKEAILQIAEKSGGYLLAGNVMMKTGDPAHAFEVFFDQYDDELRNQFNKYGAGAFSKEQLKKINDHKNALCVFGKAGALDNVYRMVDACCGILHAGGFGIAIVNTGIVNTPSAWIECSENKSPYGVLNSFLVIAASETYYYSCGMHCFGLPDVICFKDDVDEKYASWLIKNFCYYCLNENPAINESDIFSLKEFGPRFYINRTECKHFEKDHQYYNSYGMYMLLKV